MRGRLLHKYKIFILIKIIMLIFVTRNDFAPAGTTLITACILGVHL